MLVAKKIIAANLIVGGAIVVAAGTAAIAFAMSDPNCRDKIEDCSDRMRVAQTDCVIVLPIMVILKWLTQPLIKLNLRRQDDMSLDIYLPFRLVWNCFWRCR